MTKPICKLKSVLSLSIILISVVISWNNLNSNIIKIGVKQQVLNNMITKLENEFLKEIDLSKEHIKYLNVKILKLNAKIKENEENSTSKIQR